MGPFWHFAARLLRSRWQLAAAIACATVSAGGLGTGLVALAPVLDLLLRSGGTLAGWVQQHAPWLPAWLVERLSTDPFDAVVALLHV